MIEEESELYNKSMDLIDFYEGKCPSTVADCEKFFTKKGIHRHEDKAAIHLEAMSIFDDLDNPLKAKAKSISENHIKDEENVLLIAQDLIDSFGGDGLPRSVHGCKDFFEKNKIPDKERQNIYKKAMDLLHEEQFIKSEFLSFELFEKRKVVLKRKYTEKNPAVSVNRHAPVRSKVLQFVQEKEAVTPGELNTFVKTVREEAGRQPSANWVKKNSQYLTLKEGKYSLSKLGKRYLERTKVNESEEINETSKDVNIHYTRIKKVIVEMSYEMDEDFNENDKVISALKKKGLHCMEVKKSNDVSSSTLPFIVIPNDGEATQSYLVDDMASLTEFREEYLDGNYDPFIIVKI